MKVAKDEVIELDGGDGGHVPRPDGFNGLREWLSNHASRPKWESKSKRKSESESENGDERGEGSSGERGHGQNGQG